MQLVLFSNQKVSNTLGRDFGNLKKKEARVKNSEKVREFLEKEGVPTDTINRCLNSSREYRSVYSMDIDSHYLIEYYGLALKSKHYIVHLDLSNCLDLVLSILSGCDPKKISSMPNYSKISKAIMTLDYKDLDIPLNAFVSLDQDLSKYLYSIAKRTNEEKSCIEEILNSLLSTAAQITKYLAFDLQSSTPMIVRSISQNSAILTSDSLIEDKLINLTYSTVKNDRFQYSIPITINSKEVIL